MLTWSIVQPTNGPARNSEKFFDIGVPFSSWIGATLVLRCSFVVSHFKHSLIAVLYHLAQKIISQTKILTVLRRLVIALAGHLNKRHWRRHATRFSLCRLAAKTFVDWLRRRKRAHTQPGLHKASQTAVPSREWKLLGPTAKHL